MSRRKHSRDPQHHRRVSPQPLQAVELALLWHERVNDDVPQIDEHPAARAVALHAYRLPPSGLRLLHDAVRDPLHLPLAAPTADHEEVGDGGDLRDVQDEDVLGLLVARRFDDKVGKRSRRKIGASGLSHRYRPVRSMCRHTASGTRYRSDIPRAARARSSRALMSRRGASNARPPCSGSGSGAPGLAATRIVASSRMRSGVRHRGRPASASLPRMRNSSPARRSDSSVSIVYEGPSRSSSTIETWNRGSSAIAASSIATRSRAEATGSRSFSGDRRAGTKMTRSSGTESSAASAIAR